MNFKEVRKELLKKKVTVLRISSKNGIRLEEHHIQEIENTKEEYYPFTIYFGDYNEKSKYYTRAGSVKYLTMMDLLVLYYDGVFEKIDSLFGVRNGSEYVMVKLKEGRG